MYVIVNYCITFPNCGSANSARSLTFFYYNIIILKVFYHSAPNFAIVWYGILFHLNGVGASWQDYYTCYALRLVLASFSLVFKPFDLELPFFKRVSRLIPRFSLATFTARRPKS